MTLRPWILLLPPVALAAPSASTPEGEVPAGVGVAVWGETGFEALGRPLAPVLDAAGRACLVERGGISCFDDDGTEAWGFDHDGIDDVVGGRERWVVFTERGAEVRSAVDGALLETVGEPLVARDAAGEVVVEDAVEVAARAGLLPGAEDDLLAILPGPDGLLGLIDSDGDLRWLDDEGLGEAIALDVNLSDGLDVYALPDGYAVHSGPDVVLLDAGGRERGAVVSGAGIAAVAVAEGEVWVADDEGLWAADPVDGTLDDDPLEEGWFEGVAATVGGRRLVLLEADETALRVYDGDDALHDEGHRAPVAVLAPGPGGALASIDTSGRLLRWTAGGEARDLGWTTDSKAGWDGSGALWVADRGRLTRDGVEVPIDATGLNSLVVARDRVLFGAGDRVTALTLGGEVLWQVQADHPDGLRLAEGVVLALDQGAVTVLDGATGARRRRLAWPGEGASDAGVAVGGLILAGTRDGVHRAWRPGSTAESEAVEGVRGAPVLAPDGRWAAWPTTDGVVVAETGGEDVLTLAPDGDVATLAVDAERVWLGRRDGPVERWTVQPVIVDAPLPAFDGYAQLDAFSPAPQGPPPTSRAARVGPVSTLAARPDGALAVGTGHVDVIEPALGPGQSPVTVVPVVDPPLEPTLLHWDPRRGLLAADADGRLVRIEGALVEEVGRLVGPVRDACGEPGALVLATGAGVVRLDDEGGFTTVPGLPTGPIDGVACDPDGTWVAAVVEGRAHVRLLDGSVRVLRQGAPMRTAVALPRGGLVTGGDDEVAVVWDPVTWSVGYVLEGHGAPVVDLVVDPEQRRLLAVAGDGAVVWDLVGLVAEARLTLPQPALAGALDGHARRVWLGGEEGALHGWVLPEPPAAPDDASREVPALPGPPEGLPDDLPGPPDNLPEVLRERARRGPDTDADVPDTDPR